MTIDEAEKIKSVVENKKYIEQLVETVSKTLVEAFENIKIEDVDMFRLGYNKAINDFAKWLESKKYLMKEIQEHDFCYTHYDELKADYVKTEFFAEQLKAGDGD